jgi:hypothetical protein
MTSLIIQRILSRKGRFGMQQLIFELLDRRESQETASCISAQNEISLSTNTVIQRLC